ncbi:MAG TPA: hypothetical protein PK986_07615 [Spirochaetota bacterium]|nr:hypothetical protein [Spirochaetota bacterium]
MISLELPYLYSSILKSSKNTVCHEALTVASQVSDNPESLVIVIVVVPALTPVTVTTRPFTETVATASLFDSAVIVSSVPSAFFAVAVIVSVEFESKVRVSLSMARLG